MPALVVAHEGLLKREGGGVQICHREYMAALEKAGLHCRNISYGFDRGLIERVVHRISPRLAPMQTPPGLTVRVERAIRDSGAKLIFFGINLFPELSRHLKQLFPDVLQVLLSHGVESVDFCIEQRIRRESGKENRRASVAERMLGRELMDEAVQRGCVDGVLTLSPFEAEIEKWLGAPEALWLPRTIMEPSLDVSPINGRVGCVSTLNHPPNLNGLARLFNALEHVVPPELRFRLVGQPAGEGAALASRYRFVEYIGPLSDEQLRTEASTWCCFVHPMFVNAKGCSTKLAIAIGWGLPIATTRLGARGYVWDEKLAPVASSPTALAHLVVKQSCSSRFEDNQRATMSLRAIMPTIDIVGDRIRTFLGALV